MRTLWQDLRYGLRMLWKSRGFTAVSALSLALGIGANTMIFSMVNALIIRPLPYADAGRLYVLAGTQLQKGIEEGGLSYPDFVDWQEQNRSFESVAAFYDRGFNLAGEHEPERVEGSSVSANVFRVLGVAPALGRDFLSEEDQADAAPVVLISHGTWQRRFNSDLNVAGKTIRIDGRNHSIIGVMPDGFKFPEESEVWTPLALRNTEESRGTRYLNCVGRLRQGVMAEQAEAELRTIARQLEERYPISNGGWSAMVQPLREDLVGEEIRLFMSILLGAVGFVLLIACSNVANLLLARGAARQKEMGIRTALGAGRWRVVRQLLTESILVALMGGVLGIFIAMWGIDLMVASIPEQLPFWIRFDIDARVLVFTLIVSTMTGVVFGLAPALQASKPDLHSILKEGGRGSTEGIRRNRLRSALVVVEVALALVLLIGATLMIKSFLRVQEIAPGFNPQGVLTMQLSAQGAQYDEDDQKAAFFTEVVRRIASVSGVRAVGATSSLPLGGNNSTTSLLVEGQTYPPGAEPSAAITAIAGNYFEAIGIPLLQGRVFTERDAKEAPRVVIINETIARRFFQNEEPVGRRIQRSNSPDSPWFTIVGVVGDVKRQELIERPEFQLYFPHEQNAWRAMTIVVRGEGDPTGLTAAVRNEIWRVDKDQPVYSVQTMERVIAASEAVWIARLQGSLMGLLGIVALVLASIGIYGVIAYSVSRRTHEIGIRMALGAQTRDVLRLVVGQGLILISIGIVIGLAGAFLLTRAMASLLYGVTATDPVTFIVVTFVLFSVALLASYIPARRATRVDPMTALRYE